LFKDATKYRFSSATFYETGDDEFKIPPRPWCVTNEKIQRSFQCCIKDGSRPAAYFMQLKFANHLKVLCSKDMVLNVQGKGSA
jgi:hypothetical protein